MTRRPVLCRICGDPTADHPAPCAPNMCVSSRCTNEMADRTLGLCQEHLDMVVGQRRGPRTAPDRRPAAATRS